MKQCLPFLALAIVACSTPPLSPLPPTNPASSKAPAGTTGGFFSGLREDEATRTTKNLLLTSNMPSEKTEKSSMEGSEMPMNHSQMLH